MYSLKLVLAFIFFSTMFSQSVEPKYHVVKYYADWCTNCQVLKPTYKKMRHTFGNKSILFTKLDLTNASTKQQSKLFLKVLGKESLLNEKSKTGWIAVFEYKTNKYEEEK